jgi:hypothetical protein
MQALGRRCAALSLSCLAAFGCAGQSATPSAPAPPAASSNRAPAEARSPELRAQLRDDHWERVRLARHALTLELPDASGWREGDSGEWARLEHARSHSRLELNLTRAERLVRPEDCEARARLAHPELPRPAEGEALDRQRLDAPRGFLTYVTLSVNEAGNSLIEGHVTAFGAAVGRCFAFHFVTRVAGAGGESEVARRLGVVVERALPSLTLSAVDDRVSPEPFPSKSRRGSM